MIRFFLRKSAFTNLVTVILVAAGVWYALTVKRDTFPDITYDMITVTTLYPGGSPEEVERYVTNPIEEVLRGLSGVDRTESYSISSRSAIVVRLDEGLSRRQVDRAVFDIQQAVNRVRELPPEAKRPVVEEMNSDRPLIALSVIGGTPELRKRMARDLRDALEDAPGISRVVPEGDAPREIWVEADPDKLAEARLTPGEVTRALQARHLTLSAGTVDTGGREVSIRALGGLVAAEDIGDVIIRGNDERDVVRVRDVARIRETFEDERLLVRINGRPGIVLRVMKHRKGDSIRVAERVRAIQRTFTPVFKKLGLEIVESDDFSFFVKRRLGVMVNNLYQGGFLVLIALFAFLDWRLAVTAALGVPVSLATALIVGIPLGITINMLSILAFIIVLGMLDDDSVVVSENIYRHLEMGKPPLQAALDGTREIMAPVIGGVLTSCCAFLPFALVSGIMGKFLIAFPIIICLCFIASLIEAFFILPSHVVDLMKYGKPVEGVESRWYTPVIGMYRQALGWALDHRLLFSGIAVGTLALTMAAGFLRLKVVMFPPGLIDQFFVQIDMPTGTSLTATSGALARAERVIARIPKDEIDAYTSTVGMSGYEENTRRGTHLAQTKVFLRPQEYRTRSTDAIISEFRKRLGPVPGAEKVSIELLRPGPPVGRAVQVRIRGKDTGMLKRIAESYKKELRSLPGVSDIRDSFEADRSEMIVTPRPPDLAYAGLDFGGVGSAVLPLGMGLEAIRIRRPDEEVVVRVKVAATDHRPIAQTLDGLLLPTARGGLVGLGQVTDIRRSSSPVLISHYNHIRTITITASTDNVRATSLTANAALKTKFAGLAERNPGYDAIYGGEEEQTQESFRSLGRAFIVAVLADLAILTALFGSYTQPFIIILTIPIGLLGVTWALLAHGAPVSFMAMLGVVAMTGVVVNNAIVFMDFVNRRREAGVKVRAALLEAGSTRLRPIFASSITTLLGLFPTAYGWGGREPFVQPMAMAMAWGLTFAMPLTLFVIPLAYSLVEDAKLIPPVVWAAVKAALRNLASRVRPTPVRRRKPASEA